MVKKIFVPQTQSLFYFICSIILFFSIPQSYATESVTLQLKWKHQFQFAGYYAAIEKGYYRQANLDVTLIEGKPGGNEIDQVISGRANFGVGMADILLARLKGKPVVILSNIFQHSPAVLLTLKNSGFTSPHDLFAQKIMMVPGYKSAELQAMIVNEGIPIDKVTILKPSGNLDDLINGKVAAMSAYISSDPYFLKKKFIPYNIFQPSSYGIDFYGDNLFTSEKEINHHPHRVTNFVSASLKGWQYALEHSEEIIDIILSKYTSDRKDLTKEFLINEASSYQKLILPNFVKIGHMNPGRWKHIADTYVKLGMADKDYTLEGLLYDPTPTRFNWGHWTVKLGIGIVAAVFASMLILLLFNRRLNREIYDRKQTDKALLESETKYRRIYNNILDVYYESSLDGVILEISPSIEKQSQYKREELIGKSVYDIYANPADRDKLNEIIINNGSVRDYEIILTDKDGTWHTISINIELIRDDKSNPIKLVGIFRDITDRKKIDAKILESEEKFRLAFHTSPDAINLNTIVDGVYLDINDGFTKIMGYTREDVIGESSVAINIWNDLKDRKRLLEGLHKYGLVENLEANFIGKDGQIKTGLMSARVLAIANQDVILSITRDITEIKQAEKEKTKAQEIAGEHKKLALVGQVAGKMAHDFNNILGIIMGNTELSLMDCKDEETKKTLELIFEQTIRGKNLTRNLVAFAKDQEPKQEFFRISDKIDLVLNLLKKDLKGIELIKEDKPEVPDLLADAGMIEHALINLIQNAIHATSLSEHPKISIKTYCFNNMICFKIEDNGCGIPKENLKNIYDPSFTLKGTKDISRSYESGIKGTGYGMANVKKYIEQHKGSISVNSEFGSGTKFTISLPVIKKELTREEKVEIQKETICFDKSILLVEDESAISGVQYRILSQEPCNHKVDIAHDGQVAMDLFKRNKYDLISLDYALPGKINGMDVYNHIRETNKAIPILFISGNIEFLESIKNLRQKDVNIDHLSKPCQNKDYVNGINKLLERTLFAQE